jgi:hypothetical protein|tara:strand:- start:2370 stop:2723 length:354 start_codon:yes stop_codon:yes gene_type:complete
MDYRQEYAKLFEDFVNSRKIDELDIDGWSEEDQVDFYKLDSDLLAKYRESAEVAPRDTADTYYDNSFYLISISIDTLDGPDNSTLDVRDMSLEQLSKLCATFPRYNEYYFKKVAESL